MPLHLRVCIPAAVIPQQIRDVVAAYLEAHPAERHQPAYFLARAGLFEKWPCDLVAEPQALLHSQAAVLQARSALSFSSCHLACGRQAIGKIARLRWQTLDIAAPAGHEPEFDAWRWVPMGDLPGLVIPFKRAVYESVVAAFRHLENAGDVPRLDRGTQGSPAFG
jgi:Rap1a immunity proteins